MRRFWIGSFTTGCYSWIGIAWTAAALRSGPRPPDRVRRGESGLARLQSPCRSATDRGRTTASLIGSQPRCFLYGHTVAKALIRGRQVFQLHQSRWWVGGWVGGGRGEGGRQDRTSGAANPSTGFPGIQQRPFVCCPFFCFSWPGGGGGYDGRGTVVLLECAFDGGEVMLFHGGERLGWHHRRYCSLCACSSSAERWVNHQKDSDCSEPRRTFLAQRELPLTESPLPGVGGPGSCFDAALAEEGDPAFQSCWLETLASSLFQITAIHQRSVRTTWPVRG